MHVHPYKEGICLRSYIVTVKAATEQYWIWTLVRGVPSSLWFALWGDVMVYHGVQ